MNNMKRHQNFIALAQQSVPEKLIEQIPPHSLPS